MKKNDYYEHCVISFWRARIEGEACLNMYIMTTEFYNQHELTEEYDCYRKTVRFRSDVSMMTMIPL